MMPNEAAPPGYEARLATPEDLPDVAELLGAVDVADYGETVFGEDFLRREWARPRFDLSTDTVLVMAADGSVAAFAEAFAEDRPGVLEGMGFVHPEHRGRGVGAALVAAQEARAEEQLHRERLPAVTLHTAIAGPDRAAAALLGSRAYRRVRSFFHMEVSAPAGHSEPPPPSGIGVRTFVPGRDEGAMLRVLQESFRAHWGHVEVPFAEWASSFAAAPFDPGLSWVATAGDEVVGVLQGETLEGEGWVNELGVLPAWRGRGIGASLLRHAFVEFGRRSYGRVLLNVDSENETGAVGLYERVGMQVRRRWDLYEKEVRATARPGGAG